MTDLDFHTTYDACRTAILTSCQAAGAVHDEHTLPDKTGPNGAALAIDSFYFGAADADHLFVLTSGTHGVEGPAGSNAQRAWVEGLDMDSLPEGCGVLIIHAVNPWGFAYDARTTENNVDLNRNFLPDGYVHDHPEEALEYNDVFTLSDLTPESTRLAQAQMQHLMERDGPRFMTLASGGQSLFPDGMNYIGRGEEWSTRTMRKIFKTFLPGRKSVIAIDLHTGLGSYAEPFLLNFAKPGTPQYALNLDIYGEDLMRIGEPSDDHTNDASYTGLLATGLMQHAKDAQSLSVVVIEIGTLPIPDIIAPLLRENCVRRLHLEDTPQGQDDIRSFRDAFIPRDPAWQQAAVSCFCRCMDRAFTVLTDLSARPSNTV